MTQTDKAISFKAMHINGNPVVLYNVWDAGSALAVQAAGAQALATGSWSVAAAQGYGDGEKLPLDFALMLIARITASTDLPVSVDFEGCYATQPAQITQNVRKLIAVGAIGINFEDQIVGGTGLHDIKTQAARIQAARLGATLDAVPIFINARTDLFLKADPADHAGLVAEATLRATAYATSGADGFFVPGLKDPALIRQIVAASPLPVNVMMKGQPLPLSEIAKLGVARASFGPAPYQIAMQDLTDKARAAMAL